MSRIDPLGDPRPTYLQVADSIAARIRAGEFTGRLPSERTLATEYEVAYMTVRHAMDVLRERGLIITRQGRGTFVAAATGAAGTHERAGRRPADAGSPAAQTCSPGDR